MSKRHRDNTSVMVTLPVKLKKELDTASERCDLSRARLMTLALVTFLDSQEYEDLAKAMEALK